MPLCLRDVTPKDSRHWEGGQCQVTKSPYVHMLFYAAYLAIEPVTRLPFWVCSVVEWRRAYHLTGCNSICVSITGRTYAGNSCNNLTIENDINYLESLIRPTHQLLASAGTGDIIQMLSSTRGIQAAAKWLIGQGILLQFQTAHEIQQEDTTGYAPFQPLGDWLPLA